MLLSRRRRTSSSRSRAWKRRSPRRRRVRRPRRSTGRPLVLSGLVRRRPRRARRTAWLRLRADGCARRAVVRRKPRNRYRRRRLSSRAAADRAGSGPGRGRGVSHLRDLHGGSHRLLVPDHPDGGAGTASRAAVGDQAMKRFRWALSAAIVAAAGMGLAWIAYRAYAPGSLSDRIARAQQRWSVFGEPTTWSFLGRGLGITAQLAVTLALARLSRHPRLRAPFPGAGGTARVIGLLVETVRSSPLFMLIIYTFIAAPKVGLDLTPFWAGVSALTLYTSCVTSEIVRAGILSLERGQFEAAEALGLGYVDRLRFVVLPQALRRMVPAIVSQLVTLIKDTSLVSFITVVELARRGQILEQTANNPIETSLVLMAMYFVVNFALSEISRRLELRPGRAGRARPPASIGTEDQIPAVVEPTRP